MKHINKNTEMTEDIRKSRLKAQKQTIRNTSKRSNNNTIRSHFGFNLESLKRGAATPAARLMRGQQQRSCASGVPSALRYLAGTAICAVRPQLLRQLRRRHHLETLGFSEATVDHGGTFVARAWGGHPMPSRGEARRPL